MTSATRRVVHTSVEYPRAMGPLTRILTNRFKSRGLSLGGRPGAGLALKPSSPRLRTASRHRFTVVGGQPRSLPTRYKLSPWSTIDTPSRRRTSSSSADPFGRTTLSSAGKVRGGHDIIIIYAEVNNTAYTHLCIGGYITHHPSARVRRPPRLRRPPDRHPGYGHKPSMGNSRSGSERPYGTEGPAARSGGGHLGLASIAYTHMCI